MYFGGRGAGLSGVRGSQGMCAMRPRPGMWLLTSCHLSRKLQKCRGLVRLPTMASHVYFLTLAAELDTPCVTFLIRPPTFPYFISPVTPSETSFKSPMGLPRKSTDPRIRAAWLRSSCRMEEGNKKKSSTCYICRRRPERKLRPRSWPPLSATPTTNGLPTLITAAPVPSWAPPKRLPTHTSQRLLSILS